MIPMDIGLNSQMGFLTKEMLCLLNKSDHRIGEIWASDLPQKVQSDTCGLLETEDR